MHGAFQYGFTKRKDLIPITGTKIENNGLVKQFEPFHFSGRHFP
jgi:hypothetical protein